MNALAKAWKWNLGIWVLIGMALGAAVGAVLPQWADIYGVLGDVFIRVLLCTAIPLIFFNLISGLAQLPHAGALGTLGLRLMAFYLVTTTTALFLGIWITGWIRPGQQFDLSGEVPAEMGQMPEVAGIFLNLIPTNIVQAFVEGNVAQIVIFGAFLGITVLTLPERWRSGVQSFFDHGAALFRAAIGLILYTAPAGVGALTASTVADYGSALFGPLAVLVLGIWLAQGGMVVLYMVLLKVFARVSPLRFLRLSAPLYATTAASCSSVASLTVSMDIAEKRMGLPQRVYAFALPLGCQLNKDGTSIMLSSVLLFTAQAAGITFNLPALLSIILVGLILSEGSGGIPGGGLVIALLFVEAFSLPVEIAVVVGGVYRLIDMGSTTINCMGDLVGATLLTRWTDTLPESLTSSKL